MFFRLFHKYQSYYLFFSGSEIQGISLDGENVVVEFDMIFKKETWEEMTVKKIFMLHF